MNEKIGEKADELGRFLGQTDEYKALKRARERINDDREIVELLNRLGQLEGDLARMLQRGETPDQEMQEEYENTVSELQANPLYQGLVAAQSNFDKILGRVNDAISKGMESGAHSRIILS
ncbi:MAG: YlbF family regulator [Longimicrobiales bacterium]